MSKTEKTKAFIIEKSAVIFNKQGYAGTSLSDLIEITGLSKGSIYGNFGNKDEVAITTYKYNIAALDRKIREFTLPYSTATDKLKAITGFYRSNWRNLFKNGGCPILNASIEADDNLHFLKGHVQSSIKNWANQLSRLIFKGQRSGEFKTSVSSEVYAYNFIMMLEGGIMMAKIMNKPDHLFSALDRIILMIDTELKK